MARRALLGTGVSPPQLAAVADRVTALEGATGGLTPWVVIDDTDSPYTVSTDLRLIVNASAGAVSILLPALADAAGDVTVLRADSSANAVTVTPDGSETILDLASLPMPARFDRYVLQPIVSQGFWAL